MWTSLFRTRRKAIDRRAEHVGDKNNRLLSATHDVDPESPAVRPWRDDGFPIWFTMQIQRYSRLNGVRGIREISDGIDCTSDVRHKCVTTSTVCVSEKIEASIHVGEIRGSITITDHYLSEHVT